MLCTAPMTYSGVRPQARLPRALCPTTSQCLLRCMSEVWQPRSQPPNPASCPDLGFLTMRASCTGDPQLGYFHGHELTAVESRCVMWIRLFGRGIHRSPVTAELQPAHTQSVVGLQHNSALSVGHSRRLCTSLRANPFSVSENQAAAGAQVIAQAAHVDLVRTLLSNSSMLRRLSCSAAEHIPTFLAP